MTKSKVYKDKGKSAKVRPRKKSLSLTQALELFFSKAKREVDKDGFVTYTFDTTDWTKADTK